MSTIHQILKQYWNYNTFRPLQEDIITSTLQGLDVLALLPTGGGKSICYQVPALAKEGVCIVVTPLIALMRDQVMNLKKKDIRAQAIFSGMSTREIDIVLDNCIYGKVKFLYVSPERLKTELFIERLKKMQVNLLAVDEAHCISQWGYDFRPSYLEIANIRPFIPDVSVLALTASATSKVIQDIQDKLRFSKNSPVFKQSFLRKNIQYTVIESNTKETDFLNVLKKQNGCGIIYVKSRKATEYYTQKLNDLGYNADFYHAGLEVKVRINKQDAWMRGEINPMICTNAFGMGIDKPDVRYVIHLDLPDALEHYYQESGRAGRDGEPSKAILITNTEDKKIQDKRFLEQYPEKDTIRKVYRALGNYLQIAIGSGLGESYPLDIGAFCTQYNVKTSTFFYVLKFLEQLQLVSITQDIHIPSKLKFEVDKEPLHAFENRYPEYEPILKTLLRTYGGIFDYLTPIQEEKLAFLLDKPIPIIEKELFFLHKNNILYYQAKNNKPVITFLSERMDDKYIRLDKEIYDYKKAQDRAMLEYVWDFVYGHECRTKRLMRYFEEKVENCGTCDFCLKNSSNHISIESELLNFLQDNPKTLDEILSHFPIELEDLIIKTIRFLLDEEQITETESAKFIVK